MPNIFKRFLQPNASDFVFPDVEELVEEEAADTAGEQEGEPEESAPQACLLYTSFLKRGALLRLLQQWQL